MPTRYYQQKALSHARALRGGATPQERRLWFDFLRSYPVRFQRQKPFGAFIVDFYCAAAKLIIEVDGGQHYQPDSLAYDAARSETLKAQGLAVVRITNHDVDTNFAAVCQMIDDIVHTRMDQLS